MTTTETTPDHDRRNRVHALWDTVAPAWGRNADFVDRRAMEVTNWMLAATRPRRGDRVLELACGAGGTGLSAADLVRPDGRVVLSDVAPAMVEVAAKRVAELDVDGVTTAVLDLEDIDAADASFDVILCRDGPQFTVDPARAMREIARVLAPGGRIALAVWAARERNPWLGVVFDAAGAQLGMPIPPPGMPSPFSIDEPGRLAQLVHDSGLEHVVVDELSVPLEPPSVEAWWATTTSLAGPLAAILASLPEGVTSELADRARQAVAPYVTEHGLVLPGVALVTSAGKP